MAIGSLGVGIAGLAGAFDADAPPTRSYHDEMEYALLSQEEVAPDWLRLEEKFSPQWQNLALGNWGSALLGPSGRSSVPASGVLDVFLKAIAPALRGVQSDDRAADVSDLEAIAPRVRTAQRTLNPDAAAIIDLLTGGAKANLEGGLSAGERRETQQAIRAAQAARGVGFGPSDVFDEVYGTGRAAENIKAERALRALAASQGFYGDPFSMILPRGGVGAAAAGGALNLPGYINATSGGRYFNPESSYNERLKNQEYGTIAGVNMGNAANRVQYAQMTAAGGDSIGKVAAAGFGGI